MPSPALRTTAAALAMALLLALASVSGVLAKGRPTSAEITQVSCGALSVSATWWKKLTVQGITGEVRVNGSVQSVIVETSTLGIRSPWSLTMGGLGWSASTTYTVVLSLYADSHFQTLLGTASATSATISC